MKLAWSFYNSVRILFGQDSRKILSDEITDQKCLVVSTERGRQMFCEDHILSLLCDNNEIQWVDDVHSNHGIVMSKILLTS